MKPCAFTAGFSFFHSEPNLGGTTSRHARPKKGKGVFISRTVDTGNPARFRRA
jgi:hypothetical protein